MKLLLIFLFIFPQFYCRTINFMGEITCRKPIWCYSMVFWEEDNIEDDYIIQSYKTCSKKQTTKNFSVGDDDYGDGSFNYEFYTFITHNCTTNGQEVTYRHTFPDTPALQTTNVFYKIDITDVF
ncbi:unnamed protein product [Caenorhabditis angaria]|uniref:Uncharacterized protein n=1 Tax=Caenorhabditis angaria TaxID=860376 RepID=A0A9P1J4D8_9PELO|nr:unnamed protein product [Caenorhabditis angaria]